jgi:hypothetical protein
MGAPAPEQRPDCNKGCRYPIKIPAAIWCPECHLNLRHPAQISALIRKANEDAGSGNADPPAD